jgi:hypothetical protein
LSQPKGTQSVVHSRNIQAWEGRDVLPRSRVA